MTLNLTFDIVITDVDVPEPDEKSLMTYVSSLYDVFPEVPSVEQSLMDNVSTCSAFSLISLKKHDSRRIKVLNFLHKNFFRFLKG